MGNATPCRPLPAASDQQVWKRTCEYRITAAAVAGLFAMAFIGNLPAQAMEVTFTGGASGTDPLGGAWSASNQSAPSWGEPGLYDGNDQFDSAGYTGPDSNPDAVAFSFTVLGGATGGIIDPSSSTGGSGFTTRLEDWTTHVAFIPTIVGNEVVFNAPAGDEIGPGDAFFVNVMFANPVDPDLFNFTATWSDTKLTPAIPEPASLAVLGAGLIGFGLIRRRKLR